MSIRHWIALVEAKKPVSNYKVAFSWKEFNYEPLAGSFYHVDATDEMDAKRQVRKILKTTYPFGGWRVLYAFEHTNKVNEGLNSLQCDPVYDHDCPRCVFCGQTTFRGHNMVDVYACNPSRPNKDEMSVIVRYSDEPGEYSSQPYGNAKNNPSYKDAVELVNQKLSEQS